MTTHQEQAETMAREFRDALRIFDAENIAEDDAIRKAISAALSKLIEENVDRLRRVYLDYGARELLLRDEISKLIAENEGAKCQKCSTPRTRILGTVEYFKCRVCHRDEMLREQMTLIESLQSQLTATQKENERLVNDSRNDCARYDDIAAKLTAAEKENERLKKRWDYPGPRSIGNEFKVEWRESDMRHYVYDKDGKFIYSGEPRFTAYYVADVIQKLTATEARLKDADFIIRGIMMDIPGNRDWLCPSLERMARAFLSTLTAEKKEEGK